MAYQFGLHYWNEQDQLALNWESWTHVLDTIRKLNFTAAAEYIFRPLSTLDFITGNYNGVDLHPMPRIGNTDLAGPNRLYQLVAIGPSSTRTDDALKVMAYMTSYEFQLAQARQGIGSVLDRDEVREQFGADNAAFNNKQVEAFFALCSSDAATRISKYDLSDAKFPTVNQGIDIYNYIDSYIRLMVGDKSDPGSVFDMIQAQLTTFEKYMLSIPVQSY